MVNDILNINKTLNLTSGLTMPINTLPINYINGLQEQISTFTSNVSTNSNLICYFVSKHEYRNCLLSNIWR